MEKQLTSVVCILNNRIISYHKCKMISKTVVSKNIFNKNNLKNHTNTPRHIEQGVLGPVCSPSINYYPSTTPSESCACHPSHRLILCIVFVSSLSSCSKVIPKNVISEKIKRYIYINTYQSLRTRQTTCPGSCSSSLVTSITHQRVVVCGDGGHSLLLFLPSHSKVIPKNVISEKFWKKTSYHGPCSSSFITHWRVVMCGNGGHSSSSSL